MLKTRMVRAEVVGEAGGEAVGGAGEGGGGEGEGEGGGGGLESGGEGEASGGNEESAFVRHCCVQSAEEKGPWEASRQPFDAMPAWQK